MNGAGRRKPDGPKKASTLNLPGSHAHRTIMHWCERHGTMIARAHAATALRLSAPCSPAHSPCTRMPVQGSNNGTLSPRFGTSEHSTRTNASIHAQPDRCHVRPVLYVLGRLFLLSRVVTLRCGLQRQCCASIHSTCAHTNNVIRHNHCALESTLQVCM